MSKKNSARGEEAFIFLFVVVVVAPVSCFGYCVCVVVQSLSGEIVTTQKMCLGRMTFLFCDDTMIALKII